MNDQFRQRGCGEITAVTPGIKAVRIVAVEAVVEAVRTFNAFNEGNVPYGEHDMGSVDFQGARIFWKIDYSDTELAFGSPDPANPGLITRVLTIMLASEY